MRTTVLDAPPDFTDPTVQAAYLELAAAHIKSFGKVTGDWWARPVNPVTGFPSVVEDYQDGCATCTVGAVAVQLGYRTNHEVFEVVCGLEDDGRHEPHPVIAALMRALNCTKVEHVFDWSDDARDDQIVARLRDVAGQLRAQAACIDPDDTVHEHCALHGCVEYVCCVPAAVA